MKNGSSLLRHLLLLIFLSSPAAGEPTKKKNHFVLVHGSCHGAWSWYKLSTILQSLGNHVTALDMAASGVDPRQPKTISSAFHYFQPLTEFLAGLPSGERVVLVGHSFGGLGVAVALEEFPEKISVGVFVAASMAGPNLSVFPPFVPRNDLHRWTVIMCTKMERTSLQRLIFWVLGSWQNISTHSHHPRICHWQSRW